MQSFLGFRPPQFSEDAAWLPAWLQQYDVETKSDDDGTNIRKPSSHQHMEDLIKLRNAVASHPETILEDGYKSCHLFLSGEDSSPLSLVQPIDNVVQFHLHLSLDCSLENLPSTLETIPEAERIVPSHALSVQCVQPPIVPEVKAQDSKVDNFAVLGKGSNNMNKGDGHEENISSHEVSDMDDAVELSIAASEALAIHEVFKTELFSENFPASTVLEAAIQVKQARLEAWKDSHCTTEEISEIDSLTDLEDLRMEDAFLDVGLSASDCADLHSHDINVSFVKDTPASQYKKCNRKLVCEGADLHGKDIFQPGDTDIENEFQLKVDNWFGSFSNDDQRTLINDPNSVLDNIPMECEDQHISDCLNQKVNVPASEGNSFEVSMSSPSVKNFNVAGESDELLKVIPKRFESRWFGGWTCLKEGVNLFDQAKHNATRSIPEPFVGETSYLSESADIAPDASSFVALKQDERVVIASQLGIRPEGLCNKGKEIVISQDIAISSSLSIDDTLCSVVPCSISSNYRSSSSAVYDHVNDEKQQFFGLTTECAANLHENPVLDSQMVHFNQLTTPKMNGEGVLHPIRREVTSLRTYSVLPRNETSLEKQQFFDKSFLMPEAQLTNEKEKCNDDIQRDRNEFAVAMPKNASSPLVLDTGSWRHLQASIALQHDFGMEKDRRQMTEDQAAIECRKGKRVSFSETATVIQRRKKPKESHVAPKSCHVRSPTSHLELRTRELKKRVINSCARVGRRLMFKNTEFLVTGYSTQRERKLEDLIKKYGGTVIPDIPSPSTNRGRRCKGLKTQAVLVVLCSKKLQTIKFLYGCAVNAFMLKPKWLVDSVGEGCILPPERYMVVKRCVGKWCTSVGSSVKDDCSPIFENLGIMLHGERSFCTDMGKIIKHGGGKVYKTLQELVQNRDAEKIAMGVIVTENECSASRHLKHCASEGKIQIMSAYWIIRSLHQRKLLPLKEKTKTCTFPTLKLPDFPDSQGLSQEI